MRKAKGLIQQTACTHNCLTYSLGKPSTPTSGTGFQSASLQSLCLPLPVLQGLLSLSKLFALGLLNLVKLVYNGHIEGVRTERGEILHSLAEKFYILWLRNAHLG